MDHLSTQRRRSGFHTRHLGLHIPHPVRKPPRWVSITDITTAVCIASVRFPYPKLHLQRSPGYREWNPDLRVVCSAALCREWNPDLRVACSAAFCREWNPDLRVACSAALCREWNPDLRGPSPGGLVSGLESRPTPGSCRRCFGAWMNPNPPGTIPWRHNAQKTKRRNRQGPPHTHDAPGCNGCNPGALPDRGRPG